MYFNNSKIKNINCMDNIFKSTASESSSKQEQDYKEIVEKYSLCLDLCR